MSQSKSQDKEQGSWVIELLVVVIRALDDQNAGPILVPIGM